MSKRQGTIKITVAKGILLPAFVMLIVAALAFVTATYAWFSTSVPYNVDDISMSAGANSGGLYVSADCDHWSSSVSKTDFATGYEGSRNVLPTNPISPVSSTGMPEGDNLVFYSGSTTADGVVAERVAEPSAQSAAGDYYAYDLFFRAEKAGVLYLGKGSSVFDAGKSATPVSASARVAFVNYGNAADSVAARALHSPVGNGFGVGYLAVEKDAYILPQETYYYKDGEEYIRIKDYELTWDMFDRLRAADNLFVVDDSIVNNTAVRIWEPNAATHTASVTAEGVLETRAVNAPGIVTDDNTAPVAGNALFNDLDGFRRNATFVATVKPGYNKVRVYIWIEGQDADALNEVGGRTFSADLEFVLG